MKYLKLFEDFNDYDPYELMMIPPNKKAEMIMDEIRKDKPNLNLVRDLITLGADLDWQDKFGNTALHRCVNSNHPDIARMLIDAGADVNMQDDKRGQTALHECVNSNHLDIARMLIDAGADVNIQDRGGSTALHRCAEQNRPEIVKMLIDAGADLNIQRNDGFTALYVCAYWKNPEIARMLIDAGADKTIPNNDGKLPYELKISNDYRELKELLQP